MFFFIDVKHKFVKKKLKKTKNKSKKLILLLNCK